MAGPTYRKRRNFDHYTWHFCTNCPLWPRRNYIAQKMPGGPLCETCWQMQRHGNCKQPCGVAQCRPAR